MGNSVSSLLDQNGGLVTHTSFLKRNIICRPAYNIIFYLHNPQFAHTNKVGRKKS